MLFAGITMFADQANPCLAAPPAMILPWLPAVEGLTNVHQLALFVRLLSGYQTQQTPRTPIEGALGAWFYTRVLLVDVMFTCLTNLHSSRSLLNLNC
jgi:hypothetical protein